MKYSGLLRSYQELQKTKPSLCPAHLEEGDFRDIVKIDSVTAPSLRSRTFGSNDDGEFFAIFI